MTPNNTGVFLFFEHLFTPSSVMLGFLFDTDE